ncbi:MAG: hypothetical protein LBI72_05460 [Flavobacteriaceae bacterium]|jgi:hypothetical protein|nr:hypothetical protein [Flavobacteriaceae bacterium]
MTVQNNNYILVQRLSVIGSIGVILLFFFFKVYAQVMPNGIYQHILIGALYELLWGAIVLLVFLIPLLWGILYYKKKVQPQVALPFFILSAITLIVLFLWVK